MQTFWGGEAGVVQIRASWRQVGLRGRPKPLPYQSPPISWAESFEQPDSLLSQGELPSPFFPGTLLARKPPKPSGNGWFVKRTMAEKNGESTTTAFVFSDPLWKFRRRCRVVSLLTGVAPANNASSRGVLSSLGCFAEKESLRGGRVVFRLISSGFCLRYNKREDELKLVSKGAEVRIW